MAETGAGHEQEVSPTAGAQILTRSCSARALQDKLRQQQHDTKVAGAHVDDVSAEATQKKRHRRNRKAGEHHQAAKRAWKPYTEMTWDERRVKDEDDAKRARRRRDSRIASGQAMAPYNTTQFLMEQYDNDEDVDLRRLSGSVTGDSSSPEDGAGDEDGDLKEMLFLQKKEFAVDYETARADHLRSRTKEELIRDLVEIETKVENMRGVYVGPFPEDWSAEVERLKEENAKLARENCRLRNEMSALKASAHQAIEVAVSCRR